MEKRARIPIHQFISQLPILLLRRQGLPLFPLQRVLRPQLRRAERARETRPDRLFASQYTLVVGFEQDAHCVYDRIGVFEERLVAGWAQEVGFLPGYGFGPGGRGGR